MKFYLLGVICGLAIIGMTATKNGSPYLPVVIPSAMVLGIFLMANWKR